MAVYDYFDDGIDATCFLTESHIYGGKRLGIYNRNVDMETTYTPPSTETRILGERDYELSNHLNNVLNVISDRLLTVDGNSDTYVDYYSADVTSWCDYTPYGMIMPGRNATNANYRFSFQGQEKDNEIKGDNNSINYKYRMHDPRIGRFFAVDPLAAKYPHNSVYAFSENRVIDAIELEGLELFFISGYLGYWVTDMATEQEMIDYWDSETDFVVTVANYFGQSDVRYVDGNLSNSGSFGTPYTWWFERSDKGYAETWDKLLSGELVLSNDEPITIVAHSQGNAYAYGMVLAIKAYEKMHNDNYENRNEPWAPLEYKNYKPLNVKINVVCLAVFQGEEFSFANIEGVNVIQFTYENDLLDCNPMEGCADANSENIVDVDNDGFPTPPWVAHSDVISKQEAFAEIIKEDKEQEIYYKKLKKAKADSGGTKSGASGVGAGGGAGLTTGSTNKP
ncbi:MAG: hypothetical protein IPM74_13275 [Crocinitomicaceae bacterium]|nr:hypothetical protein [Crocinitomicaceae bacterium]MBK8926844.1 hypothetical protein [Crocinitomicaceae bacterium]